MKRDEIEKPKLETDVDWMPKEKNKWSTKFKQFDGGENPRLMLDLNMTAEAPFVTVLEGTGGPPLAVMVVRADLEIVSLGTAEKMKDAIKNFHRKQAAIAQMKKPSILSPAAMPKLPPAPRPS